MRQAVTNGNEGTFVKACVCTLPLIRCLGIYYEMWQKQLHDDDDGTTQNDSEENSKDDKVDEVSAPPASAIPQDETQASKKSTNADTENTKRQEVSPYQVRSVAENTKKEEPVPTVAEVEDAEARKAEENLSKAEEALAPATNSAPEQPAEPPSVARIDTQPPITRDENLVSSPTEVERSTEGDNSQPAASGTPTSTAAPSSAKSPPKNRKKKKKSKSKTTF